MSKIKLTGHASGTGVLTISAPNTSTDGTITLPDTTGTLLDENSSVPAANLTGTVADARFPATLPAASAANLTAIPAANITGTLPAISGANLTNLPAGGKILQVVSTQSGSSSGSSVSAWQTSSVAASITPSATSSKIFLTYTGQMYVQNTAGDVGYAQRFKQVITGGATTYPNELHSNSSHNYSSHYSQQTYGQFGHYTSMQGLVSPSTTSEITFTLEWHPYGVNGSGVNTLGGKSVITLLEIDGS